MWSSVSTWTMALSCSISKRCGLTRRMASWSATTRLRSKLAGSRFSTGGIAWSSKQLTDHLGNLPEFGQHHVRPAGRLLQLFRRRLERRLVAREERRFHAEAAGRRDVLRQPRTDVKHFLRTDALLLEQAQR